MFLKTLEIQGFKSFPDKTTLRFGKGVTAVVGPNGSGKSNISDAIRWVLGEMSAKTLRGSRMEDVIFGGTVLRRAQGFAEVTLTLDNASRDLAFDSDEVSVTRRYYRSGESEYMLNRKPVRLKDIYELFMDTGLGRDGYSVIGQGRIAEIISVRSEDRREIFEEAAGISKYRYRKEESERRLAEAEDNLTRLHDILDELGARVGPLKEQAEKAKKYIDLAGEKKSLEVGLWLYTLDRRAESLREQDNRIELARAQYDDVVARLDALSAETEAAYMRTQKAAALIEEHREEAKKLDEAAAAAEAEAAVRDNDVLHNKENIARLTEELKTLETSGEKQTGETEERRVELAKLRERGEQLERELEKCTRGVEELSKSTGELSDRADEAGKLLSRLNGELAEAGQDKSKAQASIDGVRERLGAIDTGREARTLRLDETRAAAQKAEEKIDELSQKAEGLGNSLKGYALKLDARRAKLAAADSRERELTLKISEKDQRASMLAELERNMEGFSRSVKAVMRESGHGVLGGMLGPVSRLIRSPGEYAAAVETALGGAAQDIVVENEEAAKAAIRFLKNTNSGRATFLPLTSVHGNLMDSRSASACEGYIGVASELVSCDAKYLGVVRSLLGRTVVVKDLDSAVNMAKRFRYGFRIVTLDGQLVNAGGSLTGGSMSRSAGLLSRASEIEALRKQSEALRSELTAAQADGKKAREDLSAIEASVAGIDGELKTAREDLIRAEGEKKLLDGRAEALEGDIAALDSEKADATGRLGELAKTLAGAEERISALTAKEEQVRCALEELGVSRGEIANRLAEQNERFNRLRLDSVACAKDADAVQSAIADLEAADRDRAGRIAAIRAEMDGLEQNDSRLTNEAAQLRTKAEASRAQARECLEKAKEDTQRRDDEEKTSVARRVKERAMSEDKEKLSGELGRLDERRTSAQSEYDGLISRLWEEYGLTRTEAEKSSPPVGDPNAAQKRLGAVKKAIKDLGGVNVGAIDEYKEVSGRYEFLKTQTEDVEKSRNELTGLIESLTGQMKNIFTEKFGEINRNFSETFTELFGGGKAHIELSDPDNVLSSGIEIIVQPPGKIIRSLASLSGGEQAFVAIALYFAILKVRPAPFCVLDEIEAALDDANVERFAMYLKRMCTDTQFIVITHRRGTMDGADVLYGVTMQDEGVSKLLTLNVDELADRLGIK